METIHIIEQFEDIKIENNRALFDGYRIITDKQTIVIGIANDTENGGCCEESGYIISEDDIGSFVGASLFNIREIYQEESKVGLKILNRLLDINSKYDHCDRTTNTIFINLETSKGDLQFAVYNNHNGYYEHNVVIDSKRLKIFDTL